MLPASDNIVSADTLYKQLGLNQAQQNIRPDLNSNYLILIVCILTNSADPDEMPPYVAFHLGESLQKMSTLYAAMKGIVD